MQFLDLSDRRDRLYFCGDIHGDFKQLASTLREKGIRDAIVIVAGDCGLGFESLKAFDIFFKHLHPELEELNTLILLVRGNHDDPEWFAEELISYPFIKALPDYTIVHTTGHNVLCVGGATSHDRLIRVMQMEMDRMRESKVQKVYWENEALRYDPQELKELDGEDILIDTVVTHPAPSLYPLPKDQNFEDFCAMDPTLESEVRDEREQLTQFFHDLTEARQHPLKHWFFGHYHQSGTYIYRDTTFRMLGIMEMSTY